MISNGKKLSTHRKLTRLKITLLYFPQKFSLFNFYFRAKFQHPSNQQLHHHNQTTVLVTSTSHPTNAIYHFSYSLFSLIQTKLQELKWKTRRRRETQQSRGSSRSCKMRIVKQRYFFFWVTKQILQSSCLEHHLFQFALVMKNFSFFI